METSDLLLGILDLLIAWGLWLGIYLSINIKQIIKDSNKLNNINSSSNGKDINKPTWIEMSSWAKLIQLYFWDGTNINDAKQLLEEAQEDRSIDKMREHQLKILELQKNNKQ